MQFARCGDKSPTTTAPHPSIDTLTTPALGSVTHIIYNAAAVLTVLLSLYNDVGTDGIGTLYSSYIMYTSAVQRPYEHTEQGLSSYVVQTLYGTKLEVAPSL